MKEETTNSRLRAMDVAALTILRTSVHAEPQEETMVHPDQLATYQGAAWDKQP
jgi:hypothetical protein